MLLHDKYILQVFLAGTIMFLIFLFFIVMYVIIARKGRHETRIKMAKMDLEYRNQLLEARLDEQEITAAYISTEIHDNVSQNIDLLIMNLKATQEAETDIERDITLNNSQAILAHVSNDLRNASYSLNGNYIKIHGLHEVVNKDLNYIQETKKMSCHLQVEGKFRSMPPETELLIYRIAQEALHNVTKYSNATNLDVTLHYKPSAFSMTITDNGVGFSLASLPAKQQTLGIHHMNQRADILKATLDISTAPNEGCTIKLEVNQNTINLS